MVNSAWSSRKTEGEETRIWEKFISRYRLTHDHLKSFQLSRCLHRIYCESSIIVVVQLLSRVSLFATLWTATFQTSLSFTISQSLLKLMSVESAMPSNHLVFCHPLLLLPSTFPSIRVLSNEWTLHIKQPQYWSFSFSISLSSEYSELISLSLLKLMSIESVRLSNHLILCCPLLLLPSIFPSIRVFSNESVLPIRWPKYWSINFSISPSNEYSGLISFRMDWFDLLAVQGTLKRFLLHHSSKASVLQHSVFFMVQLHDYWKTIDLTK